MRSRTKSDALFVRSSKVIPGGIYGHLSPSASLPRHFAHFCSKGEGVHFEDVDGNDWLDFMCAYGAVLHGYNHPEIEEAVGIQRKLGQSLSIIQRYKCLRIRSGLSSSSNYQQDKNT